MSVNTKKKASYTGQDIEVLEGLEPVRKRPGMYIAGTGDPGLHQLVFEILDNSVDEAMNGHADNILVVLHEDGESVSVSDNGRGIPVDKHPKFKKSTLEVILTTLHAGGKFSDKNYKTAGGLHGVGSSVVNALSEEMIATVRRDGFEYVQAFKRGKPKGAMKKSSKKVRGTGTHIFFRPDKEIFKNVKFKSQTIKQAIETKAYLNPGLKISYEDKLAGTKEDFVYEEGLLAYLKKIIADKKSAAIGDVFVIRRDDNVLIDLAFCWLDAPKEEYYSYVNGIYTPDGGTHEIGAKNGIVKAIRNYISVHNVQLKGLKIGADDIREGLLCLVSVKLPGGEYEAQFQGQTKSKLNNPEVAPLVESLSRTFENVLNEKPSVAEMIINRIQMAAKARAASRAAGASVRRKIGVSHRLTLPGKLADCSSNKSQETELFIVEGDSAGGSTKQGRDRNTQAVLPLRGKVLNTIAANNKKIVDNKELSNIISALGCGIGEDCDPSKLRYGKVVILTDADADGMHIATLLIAFFFQYMRPIIDSGALYIGKSPLYGIFAKGKSKDQALWAYSDSELDRVIKKSKLSSPRIVRYKGLGEMNPDTLWSTTLDPKNRTLLRITMSDEEVVAEGLKALMGNDASTRYDLIQNFAERIEVDV